MEIYSQLLIPLLFVPVILCGALILFKLFSSARKFYCREGGIPVANDSYFTVSQEFMGGANVLEFILRHYHETGPIFTLRTLDWRKTIIICDPKLAKMIVVGDNEWKESDKQDRIKRAQRVTCNRATIFTKKTCGEGWNWVHRLLAPMFSVSNINKTTPLLHNVLENLYEVFDSSIEENRTLDLSDLSTRATFDFLTTSLFHLDFNSVRDDSSPAILFMERNRVAFRELVSKSFANPYRILCFWDEIIIKARKCASQNHEFVASILNQYKASKTIEDISKDDSILARIVRG